jgi:hypothetical protein
MADRIEVDFTMLALRAKYQIPENWSVFIWELKNIDTPAEYILHTGAVVTEVFGKGPRKGCKNYAKRDKSTQMDLPLTSSELEEAAKQWSRETGNCRYCKGNGNSWFGWSAEEGNRYRFCKPCDGTGKATP